MFTIDTLHEAFVRNTAVERLCRELFIEKAILCGFNLLEIRQFIYSGNSIFDAQSAESDISYASHRKYS